jgi:hypothetical protein
MLLWRHVLSTVLKDSHFRSGTFLVSSRALLCDDALAGRSDDGG